jgi:hypothetical protein
MSDTIPKRVGRPKYPSLVCILGVSDCPNDPAFEHDHYYGCIPKDFSSRTGRSKKYRQRRVEGSQFPHGYRYLWNGGCDAPDLPEGTET